MTQGERLARIETILEEAVAKRLDDMGADIKAIRSDLDVDKADLAKLKHKGAGVLIGVAVAAGTLGANASSLFKWAAGLFT